MAKPSLTLWYDMVTFTKPTRLKIHSRFSVLLKPSRPPNQNRPKTLNAGATSNDSIRSETLLGIYISGHPLDSYRIIIEKVCNMHMDQLEDITPFANQDVMIGGIVTDLRIGQTKTGKPYGIVKMEDYSGAGELALFGDDWANFSGYFQIGNSLFVTARVEERQWKQNTYELKIGRVEFLTDVKDQKIKSITITLQTNLLNRKDGKRTIITHKTE